VRALLGGFRALVDSFVVGHCRAIRSFLRRCQATSRKLDSFHRTARPLARESPALAGIPAGLGLVFSAMGRTFTLQAGAATAALSWCAPPHGSGDIHQRLAVIAPLASLGLRR
jgi:hypothetical protein